MKTSWEKSITKGKECLLALAKSDFIDSQKKRKKKWMSSGPFARILPIIRWFRPSFRESLSDSARSFLKERFSKRISLCCEWSSASYLLFLSLFLSLSYNLILILSCLAPPPPWLQQGRFIPFVFARVGWCDLAPRASLWECLPPGLDALPALRVKISLVGDPSFWASRVVD